MGESAVQFSFRVRGKVTNEDIVCCSYTLKVVSVGRTGVLNDYALYTNAVLQLKNKHVHNATVLNKLFCKMTT